MTKGNIIVVTASQKCSNHYILGVRVLSAISMTDLSILFYVVFYEWNALLFNGVRPVL